MSYWFKWSRSDDLRRLFAYDSYDSDHGTHYDNASNYDYCNSTGFETISWSVTIAITTTAFLWPPLGVVENSTNNLRIWTCLNRICSASIKAPCHVTSARIQWRIVKLKSRTWDTSPLKGLKSPLKIELGVPGREQVSEGDRSVLS